MARKGASSTQRLAQQIANGNPPPSTIAAQIVNNASTSNGHHKPESKLAFESLLDEFLANPSTSELDTDLNVNFISIIAEGGLDALLQDSLFALDQLLRLAVKSILAIKHNIQQKPHLLFTHRQDGGSGTPQPPLFLWLLPKILGLLGHANFEPIREDLQGLLSTCLQSVNRKANLWNHAVSLKQLFWSCVAAIIEALEASNDVPLKLSSDCNILLPPSNSIGDFWPDSQKEVALPQGCQKTITSRVQAIQIGFLLLQSLVEGLRAPFQSPDAGPISSDTHLPWTLDSCLSLWQSFKQSCGHLGRGTVHDFVDSIVMQILEAAALPCLTLTYMSPNSSKAIITLTSALSDLIQSCSTTPYRSSNQIRLASLLTRVRGSLDLEQNTQSECSRYRNLKNFITDNLAPAIIGACQDMVAFNALERDLQLALCLWTGPGEWSLEVNEIRETLCSNIPNGFSDEQIRQEATNVVDTFRKLNILGKSLETASPERPSKRRRTKQKPIQDGTQQTVYEQIKIRINGSTADSPISELSGLHDKIHGTYLGDPTQPKYAVDDERCELLLAFGKVACAGSQSLKSTQEQNRWTDSTCRFCDDPEMRHRDPSMYWDLHEECNEDWKDVIAALLTITEMQEFQESSKPRVLMASALRRVFNHISDTDYLNLANSSLGKWLLASMSRSFRELRITAVQGLMVFLRDDIASPVREENRMSTLGFFQTLSKKDTLFVHETLIMAYGQAARVCGEDELPIILLQLVEYLGHTSTLICGMAYTEIGAIAEGLKMEVKDLLRPFWRSIGVAVFKDFHNKPQNAQQLADLCEQHVSELLLSTQAEILPHLVLTKRKEMLQRIATARRTTIQDVCMQPRRHLANIIALLLCQPVTDVEKSAMEALVAVAPGFRENGYDLSDLIKLEPVMVACEILKMMTDQPASTKAQFERGFYTLALLAESKNGQRKAASKRKTLETFFELHILGIMANFSDILATSSNHPVPERKKCVGAIKEMILLAGNCVSFALPQVRACLQSAMGDTHLCNQTFLVWSTLLTKLDEEDLELVIDQTFALIAQNWSSFSDDTHLAANKTLMDLVQKHNALLRERIDYIPSLASIPVLSKLESEFSRLKDKVDKTSFFNTFSLRCNDENAVVVRQALKELVPFLEANQKLLHETAVSQKPFPALPALTRSLLDACVRFAEDHEDIPVLCARCLGLVGGVDPYRVETVREKKHILVLQNFEQATEVIDFTAHLLEHILVKVFHSTTNARLQGFLAYVMQELLRHCGLNELRVQRSRSSQPSYALQRWNEIPEAVQSTLTPFLNSRYVIQVHTAPAYKPPEYPIFQDGVSHSSWLRTFTYDLLQKGKGENAGMFFPVIARVIRGHDLSIATFMLPFAALNVIISDDEKETADIGQELLKILETEINPSDQTDATRIKQCSENVFQTLDYLALWLQEKRKAVSEARTMAGKTGRGISETDEIKNIAQISCVERVLQLIPAEVISRRAVECGSYSRALYSWEQYYRLEEQKAEVKGESFAKDELLQHLQFIYAQIDEPDSIEGISAHLQVLNPEQQIMEHRKAGRWTAAQSWYELSLAKKPNDPEAQINLLTCLKESGQYDALLNYVDGFHASNTFSNNTLPFAAEAAWSTGKWDQLERILASPSEQVTSPDFNVGIGRALLALHRKQETKFTQTIEALRTAVAKELSPTSTTSLHAAHDNLIKLHVLYEIEAISGMSAGATKNRENLLDNLDRRLDILGAYTSDKQYLLGIRRAVMQLSSIKFKKLDIASAWLTTASLARKAEFTATAFNSILHAAELGDDASKIEYSKLMWKEGHHRKAIQNLQGALASNAFHTRDTVPVEISVNTAVGQAQTPNKVKCHAQLLLAKWLDRSGQTKAHTLKDAYASGVMSYPRWDKGHYYLGRHYNKLLESEKQLPVSKQTATFAAGEYNKLVIENYVRSVVYGTKYYYQTIPKVLTLWLDMGMEVLNSSPRTTKDKEMHEHKVQYLEHINRHIKRYTNERMPTYSWYIAFPQIITRISHPHKSVWEVLQTIIVKVASQYPQQSLWSLLAVTKATQDDRRSRGLAVLQKLRADSSKKKGHALDLKTLIVHGQRLTDALLSACDQPVEPRISHVSLSRDLNFNHKLAPCALVVPIEATMTANLPAGNDSKVIRTHSPFPQDAITISSFMDDVLVLSSLQRPRKVNVRGSDGRSYGLLCKPKDDLRKDQRLMEFNAMINRALTRDIESSKRRLYIKTYGVTPLNEECGTIEWVEGLKPMRDIIIRLYRQKNVTIDYGELRMLLNEACSDPSKISIFTQKILKNFPAVLYEWFIETFPEPEAWFAARLRYTRSCAVMSIVGHVLGLGDRHGENVLLEEGNGGTFHVDFNCLFDKGLTFEKPELVPFRLTHNMVDAMGPSGIEGPFRTAAELTYTQLRQHQDTLITILETFVHDPTADFLGGKRRKKIAGVPDTPQEVLETVGAKVEGLMKGETVPLSVEGYVDALCQMARDPRNLCAMYIGWCAFF